MYTELEVKLTAQEIAQLIIIASVAEPKDTNPPAFNAMIYKAKSYTTVTKTGKHHFNVSLPPFTVKLV